MALKSSQDTHERLAEIEDKAVHSPEMMALLEWLESRRRSLQEVSIQLARLGLEEQTHVIEHLESSSLYDTHFLLRLNARVAKEPDRGAGLPGDAIRHLRDAPESMQRVLHTINHQRSVGRNLMALTPERLPDELLQIWNPQRQLPEMILINLDCKTPQVTVVRRLPSAGGMHMDRTEAMAMNTAVRQILGKGKNLANICKLNGLEIESIPLKVDVNMAEVSWSPHLELGEYLYDFESTREQVGSQASAISRLENAGHDLVHQEDVLIDLQNRIDELGEAWQLEGGEKARQGEDHAQDLKGRWEGHWTEAGQLLDARRQLQNDLDGPAGSLQEEMELKNRLDELEASVEALSAQTLELSKEVAEAERNREEFLSEQEVELAERDAEGENEDDEAGDDHLRERAKAERKEKGA